MFDFTNNHLVYLYKEKNTIVKNDEKKKKHSFTKQKYWSCIFSSITYDIDVCAWGGGGWY